MSLKLAKMSSASSSMYLFSCSRLRFSLLLLGLRKKQRKKQNKTRDQVLMSWKTIEMYTDVYHSNQIKKGKKALQKCFKRRMAPFLISERWRKKPYLGPKSSDEQSLRFRDSALAGSDGVSPTPLIIKAYQRLKRRIHLNKCKHGAVCSIVRTQSTQHSRQICKQQIIIVVVELKNTCGKIDWIIFPSGRYKPQHGRVFDWAGILVAELVISQSTLLGAAATINTELPTTTTSEGTRNLPLKPRAVNKPTWASNTQKHTPTLGAVADPVQETRVKMEQR